MGLLPQPRKAHVDTRKVSYVDADGHLIGSLRPEAITGGAEGLDLEVPRGDLADALYAHEPGDRVHGFLGFATGRLVPSRRRC